MPRQRRGAAPRARDTASSHAGGWGTSGVTATTPGDLAGFYVVSCTLQVHKSIFQAVSATHDLLDPESHGSGSWSLDQSHVIIASWMLQAKVDRQEVDCAMQLLDSDVNTL
eukprot:jgi/Ulvmu1/9780/UM056_0020.1